MQDYFIGVHQQELERLERQHTAWQPETQAFMQAAGLPDCSTILDLGCGPGFTTFELAKQCPAAHITALDKAELYQSYLKFRLQQEPLPTISPLHADVLDLSDQVGNYQGVFCRWFLAFLIADLRKVLQAIYDKLEVGGVFAAMEYLTLDSFTAAPPSKYFTAYTRAWKDFYWKHGGDATIGTFLPALLREVGFQIDYQKCVGGFSPVHHRWWNWWRDAFDNFAPTFVEQGLLSPAEQAGMAAYWEEQDKSGTGFIYSAVILQISARKV